VFLAKNKRFANIKLIMGLLHSLLWKTLQFTIHLILNLEQQSLHGERGPKPLKDRAAAAHVGCCVLWLCFLLWLAVEFCTLLIL
jgi:hypothetical protein